MNKLILLTSSAAFTSTVTAQHLEWKGHGTSNNGWTMDALVQVKAEDVTDNQNILDKISYWKVTWSKGQISNTLSSKDNAYIVTDASLRPDVNFNFTVDNNVVVSAFLCAWDCDNTNPSRLDFGIYTQSNESGQMGVFDGDISADDCCIGTTNTTFSWSRATSRDSLPVNTGEE